MALIENGVTYRNIQEQVKKNKDDIAAMIQGNIVMQQMGIKVVGHCETASELPNPLTYSGEYGDAYTVGEETPYLFYIFTRPANGIGSSYWFNLGEFPARGPRGATGATGSIGPVGPQGAGVVAKTFDPSSAYSTYAIGSCWVNVVTGNVFVYQGSGVWQQSGNWKGPQGATGATGQAGPQGETGATGPQGPRGESGGFANFLGVLESEENLPDPTLLNKHDGYLVGESAPYDAYVIIGQEDNKATWQWCNVGASIMPTVVRAETTTGTFSGSEITALLDNENTLISYQGAYLRLVYHVPSDAEMRYESIQNYDEEEVHSYVCYVNTATGVYQIYINYLGTYHSSTQTSSFINAHVSGELSVEGDVELQEDLTVDGKITVPNGPNFIGEYQIDTSVYGNLSSLFTNG